MHACHWHVRMTDAGERRRRYAVQPLPNVEVVMLGSISQNPFSCPCCLPASPRPNLAHTPKRCPWRGLFVGLFWLRKRAFCTRDVLLCERRNEREPCKEASHTCPLPLLANMFGGTWRKDCCGRSEEGFI